jgi:hypothetical protein
MPSAPPSQSQLCDIYVDESSQTKHRYLALGCLVVPTPLVAALNLRIEEARIPELPRGEMAWTKVSASKLPAYRRAVETILQPDFEMLPIQFHSLFVDTHKIRDNIYNAGSREDGFNKEIYQLLMKCFRLNSSKLFHVYLDRRNTSSSPKRLRDILNFGARKKIPSVDWPFRRVHFRDSHETPCIQIVDILLGAIAFHINGHRQAPDASPAKCSLSDHILRTAHVHDPLRGTAISGRFTIWPRQLR